MWWISLFPLAESHNKKIILLKKIGFNKSEEKPVSFSANESPNWSPIIFKPLEKIAEKLCHQMQALFEQLSNMPTSLK